MCYSQFTGNCNKLRSLSPATCWREAVIYFGSKNYHSKDGRRMETWYLLLHEWTRWLWNVLLRSLLPPMWCLQNCWKDWRIWYSLWIVDLLPSLHWCNALDKEDQEEVQHWGIWPRGCRHLLPLHTLCLVSEFQRDQRQGVILTKHKTKLSYKLEQGLNQSSRPRQTF